MVVSCHNALKAGTFCACWASACVFIRHFAQATVFLLEVELLFMLITSCYSRGIGPVLVGIYWSNSVRSALNERCSVKL